VRNSLLVAGREDGQVLVCLATIYIFPQQCPASYLNWTRLEAVHVHRRLRSKFCAHRYKQSARPSWCARGPRTFQFLLADQYDGRPRDGLFGRLLGLGHGAHERRTAHGNIAAVSRAGAVGAHGGAFGASEQVGRMDRVGFACVLLLVEGREHPLRSMDVDLEGAGQ
jgi:hypothetical protein